MKISHLIMAFFGIIAIGLLWVLTNFSERNPVYIAQEKSVFPSSDATPFSMSHPQLQEIINETDEGNHTIRSISLEIHATLDPKVEDRIIACSLYKDNEKIMEKKSHSTTTECIEFTFDNLTAGKSYTIIATASGYIPTQESMVADDGKKLITLSIFQNPILSLAVHNENDQPVSGAECIIQSNSQGIFSSKLETNNRGMIETELPFAGDYEIAVTHPLHAEKTHKVIRIDRNPNHLKIFLPGKSGMIFGRVVNDLGHPLPNAVVSLFGDTVHNRLATAETIQDGLYAFNSLRLSNYYLNVDAGDLYIKNDISYSEQKKKDSLFPPITLTPENPNAEVNFTVIPAVSIKGKVVNENNQPVSDAIIKAGIQGTRETSVRPVYQDIHSDENGEFFFPIMVRVDGWTTLLLSAIHPEYGHKTKRIEQYAERAANRTFLLALEKSSGVLKGSVVTFHGNVPVSSVPLEIISYVFRNDERFHHILHTDENGNFYIELLEDHYFIRVKGYTVKSPQSFDIDPKRETEITLFVEKDDEEKVSIQGIVVNSDHSPIHGARVFVKDGERSLGRASSNPDGKFQVSVNTSGIRDETLLTIYHPDYQLYEIPLIEIADWSGIAAVLREHQGAIKVVLTGIGGGTGLKIHLHNLSVPFKNRTYEKIDGTTVYLRNIDESLSPFYLMAANSNYAGISPVFDLSKIESRYVEIEIPMQPIGSESTVQIRVVDEQTGNPVDVATCEIQGNGFGPWGEIFPIKKRMITLSNGVATLTKIPLCIGSLSIRHVYYRDEIVPFYHDGIQENRIETIQLKREIK